MAGTLPFGVSSVCEHSSRRASSCVRECLAWHCIALHCIAWHCMVWHTSSRVHRMRARACCTAVCTPWRVRLVEFFSPTCSVSIEVSSLLLEVDLKL